MEETENGACHTQTPSNKKDWISQLPDDVLMIILSSLLMREAARTCVLSRRWRKPWKHFTGSLDFDASDTLRLIAHLEKDRVTEARRYRDWVDEVLVSHEGSSLKGLRIAFVLGKSNVAALNKWLCLAIVKRVQRLELDLSSEDGCVGCTDNDLAYFLSKCSLLEQLTVENSAYLHKVRVAARQSLKLKHLEIRYCLKLEDVEVSARSVASFKYAGRMININVPESSSISLAVEYCEMLFVKFPRIWSFSGLQQLELNLRMMEPSRSMSFPKDIPELSELKQLELKLRVPADHSILFLSSIIRASPRLLELILKYRIEWFWPLETETLRSLEDCEKEWKEQAGEDRLRSLKEIEFVGWIGLEKTDARFAHYLMDSAISLEKLILDFTSPCVIGKWHFWETPCIRRSREDVLSSALQLETKLPPTAKLIML